MLIAINKLGTKIKGSRYYQYLDANPSAKSPIMLWVIDLYIRNSHDNGITQYIFGLSKHTIRAKINHPSKVEACEMVFGDVVVDGKWPTVNESVKHPDVIYFTESGRIIGIVWILQSVWCEAAKYISQFKSYNLKLFPVLK